VGYSKNLNFSVIQHILNRGIQFIPILKNVAGIRMYSGLRPYTSDNVPIMGETNEVRGFVMAAGHEGSGITLAPITGKLVSEIVTKNMTTLPIERFSLSRFSMRDREVACA
jgi:sarcosine oxidase subunit beta